MAFTRFRLALRTFVKSQCAREGRVPVRRIRPTVEVLEDRLVPAQVFTVTQNTDNGNTAVVGSLSWAINQAEQPGNSGSTIDFAIGAGGTQQVITVTGDGVKGITQPMFIDGLSQGGVDVGEPYVGLKGAGVVGDG